MNTIIYLLKLPWLLLRTLWLHGVPGALAMTYDVVVRRRMAPGIKFPHESPSNSAAYIPLLRLRPLISIVMPVYNSQWLREAAASILRQTYDNFELIMVDDCSTDQKTIDELERLDREPRVRRLRTESNMGISGATNHGIAAARGEYIAFMDHDDLLHHDALALVARVINQGVQADVFFTDEARLDQHGYITALMRKSQPSLDLLLSCNAILHFCVIHKPALDKLGPLNSDYDGSQDHDLMLRAMEHNLRFHHLPYLLYGWRIHETSTSASIRRENCQNAAELPMPYRNGKKMISDYLTRHDIQATVTDDGFPWYRVKYKLPEELPEIAVIVPFRDGLHHLKTLMTGMQKTTWPNYRIYLVNNRSQQPATMNFLKNLPQDRISVLEFDEPFNYSRLHNKVVAGLDQEVLVFLNNDTEVISCDWMESLYEHLQRDGVAAVGCKLIRADGTVQHAGVTFQPSILQCATHITDPDHFIFVQREVSGVTAACMMIRRSAFLQVGGFDEVDFPIGFSDADLCLRLRKAGFKIMYTPFAVMYHHESRTRRQQEEAYEKYTMFTRYAGQSLMVDPHYHTLIQLRGGV